MSLRPPHRIRAVPLLAVLAALALAACIGTNTRQRALVAEGFHIHPHAQGGRYLLRAPDESWSIELPGLPEIVETGNDRIRELQLVMDANSRVYQLTVEDYAEYPEGHARALVPQARDTLVDGFGARILLERRVAQEGLNGVVLALESVTQRNHEALVWVLASDRYLFTLQSIHPPSSGASARMEAQTVAASLSVAP